jgi:hypothetical protein
MPLERLLPDELELISSVSGLPRCPFCGCRAIMFSSSNDAPLCSDKVLFQTRISCTNHHCNASVFQNTDSREESQQCAIKQWSARVIHEQAKVVQS